MRRFGPEHHEEKTMEELLNGERGTDYWSPSDYSDIPDPDYESVDSSVFDALDQY